MPAQQEMEATRECPTSPRLEAPKSALEECTALAGEMSHRRRDAEALAQSELRYRRITEAVTDYVFTVRLDHGRPVETIHGATCVALTGYTPEEFASNPHLWLQMVATADRERVLEHVQRLLSGQNPGPIDHRIYRKNGALRWVQNTSVPQYDSAGRLVSYDGLIRDITERKLMEEALRLSEERLRLALEAANAGLWDRDLRSGVTYFSPHFRTVLGYEPGEPPLVEQTWRNLIHPHDRSKAQKVLQDFLARGQGTYENAFRMRTRTGDWRWIVSRGRIMEWDAEGQPTRFVGTYADVTDHKAMEEQLRRTALCDSLTGLPNRASLLDRLRSALHRSKRHSDYQFAVLFLDFDGFKIVNDSLGHRMGDQLLIAITQRLQACVRAADVVSTSSDETRVGRLGGDEFLILLDGISATADAARFADRLLESLAVPFDLQGLEVHTTASIGIVTNEGGYDRPEDLIRDADTAMYRAKGAGKGRYVIFDRQMHDQAIARLSLEGDLRKAIERREFRVVYQPIVGLESGKVAGFEALVRWERPGIGLISPEHFIPLAEETGLIVPLGAFVLEEACRQMGHWEHHFPQTPSLSVSVNVSKRQLLEKDITGVLEHVLEETEVTPELLHLEVTESVIMEQAVVVTPALIELKRLGVKVDMDDFGTGHSSLSCLHEFPVDCLKIDRAFIGNMGLSAAGLRTEYTAIVQAIITLAHNLGMSVVAEGIETVGQLAQLQSLGCDLGQGYWFAPPLEAAAAANLIPVKSWCEGPLGLYPSTDAAYELCCADGVGNTAR